MLCLEFNVLSLPLVASPPVCRVEGERLLELEFLFEETDETSPHSRTVDQLIRIQAP